jgi:hypothetical protein
MGRTVQRGLRPTGPSNDLTTAPQQGQTKDQVEEPDRPAARSRPHEKHQIRIVPIYPRILHRWIEAEEPSPLAIAN